MISGENRKVVCTKAMSVLESKHFIWLKSWELIMSNMISRYNALMFLSLLKYSVFLIFHLNILSIIIVSFSIKNC